MNRRELLVAGLALVFAPSALARSLGGTPVALVTADLESHLVVVHVPSGRVLRRIPTLPGPRSIERVAETAVVAHTAHGAVTLVDGTGLRIRKVIRSFDEPRYTTALPGGRYAAVSDSGAGSVVVLDTLHGSVAGRVKVGGPARHISVDPAGKRLWVSLGSRAPRIAVVDVRDRARPRLLGRVRPPFLAHDVGFAGRRIWVTSGDRNELALFDPRTARTLVRLPAGSPPQHVAFSDEGHAFVTSGDDGTLRVHDARSGRQLRTTGVPVGSYNVQQDWGLILTPSLERGTLCIADWSGRVLHRVRVARSSHDACLVMSR